jgi:4-hydroxy-3-polyprenylbenzoate decarboxylase
MDTPGGMTNLLEYSDHFFQNDDFIPPIASGSFLTDGMVVVPCSIKTLSGIVHSYNDTLLIRAADVTLKEKRKLVLVVRETPLHSGHLKLMYEAANLGAIIMPPVTCFYNKPESIDQIVDHLVGKILDQFDIEHNIMKRWGEL